MSASKGEVLSAVWSTSPNTSRFDEMLGLNAVGLSLMHFSMFNPGIALMINTSEVQQQGSMDHGHGAPGRSKAPVRPPTAPEAKPLAQGRRPLGPRGAPSPLGGRSEAAAALRLPA